MIDRLPNDIFIHIIKHLVTAIGLRKAVLLRKTCRSFNVAILEAICIFQVVDIDNPATPYLVGSLGSTLRGKILLAKSCSANTTSRSRLSVLKIVNFALDALISETDEVQVSNRHESVAQAVGLGYVSPYWGNEPVDANLDALNLLCGAIVIGSLPLVKSFLDSSPALAEVNGVTPYFGRPLVLAAAWGHIDIVRYLLDRGARPDLFSEPGEDSQEEITDWDPKEKAVPSVSSRESPVSALRAAVLGGYGDIVDILLLPRHRLPSTKLEYLRAVLAGVRAGRLDLIKTIFQNIGKTLSDFPELGDEMLWEAIRCDRKDVVQLLLDNGVNIHAFPWLNYRTYHGTLSIAAIHGNTSMARFLIERGADVNFEGPNIQGSLPIEAAAQCGQEEVVELFLELGADPRTALRFAAYNGQPRVIKLILDRFPDLILEEEGEEGRRAICAAICSRNLTAINLLVEAGVSLNDGYEYSSMLPVNAAKQIGAPWVVKHLLSLGAQDTDDATLPERTFVTVRGILVSERTWEWVSKY